MSDSDQPSDTMRERAGRSSWLLYLRLDANRWLVAGLLSLVPFLALVAAGVAHSVPAQTLLTTGDPIETLFQALVTGIITAVTLA